MRVAAAIAGVVVVTLCSGGCGVGWVIVRPPRLEQAARAAPDWSHLRFTVQGPSEQRWGLLRVLRARYGVLDAREGPPLGGAFHIEATPEEGTLSLKPLMLASVLTFAVIPGVWSETKPVRYVLVAPSGVTAEARAERRETSISWLPLVLLGPTMSFSINGARPDESELSLARAEATEAQAACALVAFEGAVSVYAGSVGTGDGPRGGAP